MNSVYGLDDAWQIAEKETVNILLNYSTVARYYPKIEVDAGMVNEKNEILPIELETIPHPYVLVQTPHYCARARHVFYQTNQTKNVSKIKTLVLAISSDDFYIKELDGNYSMFRVLYLKDENYNLEMKIIEKEHPIFYNLQQILHDYSSELLNDILDNNTILDIGKVFIIC